MNDAQAFVDALRKRTEDIQRARAEQWSTHHTWPALRDIWDDLQEIFQEVDESQAMAAAAEAERKVVR